MSSGVSQQSKRSKNTSDFNWSESSRPRVVTFAPKRLIQIQITVRNYFQLPFCSGTRLESDIYYIVTCLLLYYKTTCCYHGNWNLTRYTFHLCLIYIYQVSLSVSYRLTCLTLCCHGNKLPMAAMRRFSVTNRKQLISKLYQNGSVQTGSDCCQPRSKVFYKHHGGVNRFTARTLVYFWLRSANKPHFTSSLTINESLVYILILLSALPSLEQTSLSHSAVISQSSLLNIRRIINH